MHLGRSEKPLEKGDRVILLTKGVDDHKDKKGTMHALQKPI